MGTEAITSSSSKRLVNLLLCIVVLAVWRLPSASAFANPRMPNLLFARRPAAVNLVQWSLLESPCARDDYNDDDRIRKAPRGRPWVSVTSAAAALATVMLSSQAAHAASSLGAAATFSTSTAPSLGSWQIAIGLAMLLPSLGSVAWSATWQILQASLVWYMAVLHASPLITKSVTAGVIGVLGDYFAQGLERMLLKKKGHYRYDGRRGLSILIDGLFISGPLMHLAYELFEKVLPVGTGAGSSSLAAMAHVLADSVLLDSIFVATTFIVTGVMEGYKRRQVVEQLQKDYAPTLVASWVTSASLLPIEFVCFRYLPVSLRVLAVNFIDVIWDTVISFMAHRSRHVVDHVVVVQEETTIERVTAWPDMVPVQ